VAIVGAPNAGKSSLMNRLLGQKVAIVTHKPQTTRHRLLGVLTEPSAQIVFWDTPGVHESPKALNQSMVSRALAALADCDVCLWLVDGARRGPEHARVLEALKTRTDAPLMVAVNKADLLDPEELPALLDEFRDLPGLRPPDKLLAVSAKTGKGLKKIKKALASLLPVSPPLYEADALTDQTLRAMAAEYVREAVFELTRQEIPYSTAVTVDEYLEPKTTDKNPVARISCTVHVERESQKKVMIGAGGRTLKKIGQTARRRLEELLETKVFLSLFVRITDGWSEDPKALEDFGYLDPREKR
jgi:GTP-binding protein Era